MNISKYSIKLESIVKRKTTIHLLDKQFDLYYLWSKDHYLTEQPVFIKHYESVRCCHQIHCQAF